MRLRVGLVTLGAGLMACTTGTRPARGGIAPATGVERRPLHAADSTSLFRIGPRDGMRCGYIPLEHDERTAGVSTHLEFTIGQRTALHRVVDLWTDALGPVRLAVTQYRGVDWAFDTSWTAMVAFSRDGAAAGLLVTLPPPIVDSTVFPPRVTKGGSSTADLTADEGRLARELATWLWEGRCPDRRKEEKKGRLPGDDELDV